MYTVKCLACDKGHMRHVGDCPVCNGTGELTFDYPVQHCRKCWWYVDPLCKQCGGTGYEKKGEKNLGYDFGFYKYFWKNVFFGFLLVYLIFVFATTVVIRLGSNQSTLKILGLLLASGLIPCFLIGYSIERTDSRIHLKPFNKKAAICFYLILVILIDIFFLRLFFGIGGMIVIIIAQLLGLLGFLPYRPEDE